MSGDAARGPLTRARGLARAVTAAMRVAFMVALQYRASFLGEALMALLWIAWTVLPLVVVFRFRPGVAGWTYDEALLVVGFFVTLEGIMQAFVDPNLRSVVEHVRQGTLDFVLLKPVDAQLLVSVQRTAPTKVPHALAGLLLVGIAVSRLPVPPSAGQFALAALLLLAAIAILHSVLTIVVSTSFWFVRVDNLSYLLGSLLEAGRWPVPFYRGAVRFILTFVVPVGLMTTWPALALRGSLTAGSALLALGVGAGFVAGARAIWLFAIRRYASASS